MDINIALIGYGVVNSGVHKIISSQQYQWREKYGIFPVIHSISVKHPEKHEDISDLLTSTQEIISNPQIHIIIEAISESTHLLDILQAFQNGKHVISANKKFIAENFDELTSTATQFDVNFLYEASVCAVIPIINILSKQIGIQKLSSIKGVFNGTCNFILNQLEDGNSFSEALKNAQHKGYAEQNPSSDIDGLDTAYKLFILSKIIDSDIEWDDITIRGIRNIDVSIIQNAIKNQERVKLIAEYDLIENKLSVSPQVVTIDNPLYNLIKEENGVIISGETSGDIYIQGRGAGSLPTANAIVQNLIDIILEVDIHEDYLHAISKLGSE